MSVYLAIHINTSWPENHILCTIDYLPIYPVHLEFAV